MDAPISKGLTFHVSSSRPIVFTSHPLSNLENSCPNSPTPVGIAFLGMFGLHA